ncbi:hypothetical protein ENSA5_27460 [Enhygromyxa salina]|uniref:Uncharacterized protein n=1 Tax=Enhygromyxa salina TaxID=215803 RepID=A0A2S9Y7I6_9BACT|nr:hypothetical protein [Enhygromyxa salina]PRQ01064.1 hypothetical protein ENSA5_27460 [Enhygromyxa salina]
MAPSPGKRSARKSTVGAGKSSNSRAKPPPLVDPEAVAAVREATTKTVHALTTAARALAGATAVSARWLWPRLARATVISAAALGRALSSSGAWLWTRRSGVARIGHRGLWWGALAILVLVGRALLSAEGDPELVEVALLWFGAGLSMSVLVLVSAPETRMRVAAFALASGHASLAALTWVAVVNA